MTGRKQRLLLVLGALVVLGIGATLILSAFKKNLVFFFTPTQILAGEAPRNQSLRVGGMVEKGSVKRSADGVDVSFIVTDTVQRLPVRYRGMLPDLFREGKGVVAQGRLGADNLFVAAEVLAKHDENYMPPDAAFAMKQAATARAAGLTGAAR
jgi:cytochrome c-type biogenesis protein CcmE